MRRALPLLFVSLAFFALALLWIVTDRRAAERVYDAYSSANTSDAGLSLAFGYLAKQRKVAMLTTSLARANVEPNAVIFRIADELPVFVDLEALDEKQVGPPKPKTLPLLSDAEEAFVRGGGRMVVAAKSGLLSTAAIETRAIRKVFPIWPAVKKLALDCDCAMHGFVELRPRMHVLFTAGARPVLARERIGSGEVFVLSLPELLANEHLGDANHLALVAALAGDRRPVYFDEVLHGIVSDDGSLALMKEWNLGPFLLLLAAIALLVFWREGRRVGPPDDDFRETRSDAVDLVRSLGALYRDVTTDAEAIALYHDALTRTVAHQTGLRGDALRTRVDDLTGGLVPPKGTGKMPLPIFKRQLDAINQGFAKMTEPHGRVGG